MTKFDKSILKFLKLNEVFQIHFVCFPRITLEDNMAKTEKVMENEPNKIGQNNLIKKF